MARYMGIGPLGFRNTIFKRKFRFTFEIEGVCNDFGETGSIREHYVKSASRPSLDIEETEINFLNGKTFLPGKGTWQEMTVTYYDVIPGTPSEQSIVQPDITMQNLWKWMASTYDFTDPVNLRQGASALSYAATGILRMYDGCGTMLEHWVLYNLWPKAINFGDLDYSSSEEATIELTLRYDRAMYVPDCPSWTFKPCCYNCDGVDIGGTANTVEYELGQTNVPSAGR